MARMIALVIALVVSTTSVARSDPGELGRSSKGRAWWEDRGLDPVIAVTPIWESRRHVRYVAGWAAGADGTPIDHAQFYELVGRPELARAVTVRRTLGALAIIGGVAASVLGGRAMARDPERGTAVAWYLAGLATTFTGVYVVASADPISADQATQLANDRRAVVAFGGRF